MAYVVGQGDTVQVRHAVLSIGGVPVSGQAANVVTALSDPQAQASAIPVNVSEIGSSGWYLISFVPDAVGVWNLQVTNPPGTNQQTSGYDVQVFAAQLSPLPSGWLTSRDRVLGRLDGVDGGEFDALIDSLISEISADMIRRRGAPFHEVQRTDYYDGPGALTLFLRSGPLVSVQSVESIEYKSDGAGGVTEDPTLIEPHVYRLGGLRDEGHLNGGWLVNTYNSWWPGARNFKVTMTGGFSTIPEDLVHNATNLVVWSFLTREAYGLVSKTEGDFTLNSLSPTQMDLARDRAVVPYRVWYPG